MPCVIEVLVKETHGSAPREEGTRMWVSTDEVRGTIGGGALEHRALAIAREMLVSGEPRREQRFSLGDVFGQCCGGSVNLAFTAVEAFPEASSPAFHVVLFGAGHVGKEVARILARLPCTLTWIDSRADAFPPSVDANTTVRIDDEPAWLVDDAPPGALLLVMTHSHALDYQVVERALARRDLGFVGMIGSQTKAARFRKRLARSGLPVERLVSPIGLFKAGKHPAEIAVSAVAQLLERISSLSPAAEATR